jgi:type II secretory pathway pseudopilin PulG
MKINASPRGRVGFTLVELLVVMAIIIILAAVVIYAATPALNAAKRVTAGNIANQIKSSAVAYDTEYSFYPNPGATTDYEITDNDTITGATSSKPWGNLIDCLAGGVSVSTGSTTTTGSFTNTRSIQFLTLRASDVCGTVFAADPDAPRNPLYPSTANPTFNIAFDTDYDGILGGTDAVSKTWLPNLTTLNTTTAPATGGTCTDGVAVWANCVGSTTKYNSNQWVKTY